MTWIWVLSQQIPLWSLWMPKGTPVPALSPVCDMLSSHTSVCLCHHSRLWWCTHGWKLLSYFKQQNTKVFQRSSDTFNIWHKVKARSLLQDMEVGNFCYFMQKTQLSSAFEWVASCRVLHAVRRNEHLKTFWRVLPALLCGVVMIPALGTVHVTPLALKRTVHKEHIKSRKCGCCIRYFPEEMDLCEGTPNEKPNNISLL